MFSVIQAGLSLNRKINIFNIVFFTAFSILVARPSEISNPGFQLSFIAVLGIVYFQPFFYRLFVFKNLITDKLWMLFTVSVSAELGVFPIIIYYFHNFPVYFWLSNLLLIFPLALAIYLAILLFIFCQFSQIAFIIATVLNFLIKLINSFILKIEKLPGSLVENIYNNASETALLYMFIISVSIFIILKNRKYLSVSLFCMLCFLAVNFTRVCKIYRQNKIIVFNLSKHTAVNLITGRNSYLLTDLNPGKGMSTLLNTVRPCWLQYGVNNAGKIINTENIPDDLKICDDNAALCVKKIFNNIFIIFRDRNLLILSDSDLFEYETGDKYRLDYLIISGNLKCRMDAITAMFDADKIIIDSSNDFLARRFWEKECEAYGIDCYIISDEGAFEMEL